MNQQSPQQPGPGNPDALALGQLLTEAMSLAMRTEFAIITTMEGRPIRRTDTQALTNAGMVGWQAEVYRLLTAPGYSPEFRALVLRQYREKQGEVLKACRAMARALTEK